MKHLIVVVGLCLCGAVAYAQQCLHGPGDTPEQQARRRQAVAIARIVNSMQANQPGAAERRYLSQEDLATHPFASREPAKSFDFRPGQEIVPGYELTLDVTEDGYWFMVRDKADSCGFVYFSNQSGIIYSAEPIR